MAFTLGDALAATGKTDAALEAYETSIRLDRMHGPAHFHKGLLLSKKGDVAGAVAAYRAALKVDPNLARARAALGRGDFEDQHDVESGERMSSETPGVRC